MVKWSVRSPSTPCSNPTEVYSFADRLKRKKINLKRAEDNHMYNYSSSLFVRTCIT